MRVHCRTVWLSVSSLSFLIAFSMTAGAQNWPSFRGRHASGVADGMITPTRWDVKKSLNIRWKRFIPGSGHSSVVVWGNKVFLTTAVSSDTEVKSDDHVLGDMTSSSDSAPHAWRVYCFDKLSGKLIWQRKAYRGTPKNKRHPMNSFATPTPAVDGKHVVAFFGSEGLYCYDLNGRLIWKKDLGTLNTGYYADSQYQWAVGSSPIIYRNLVILQCDVYNNPFIAAYNIDNGKLVWMVKRDDNPSWGTPTIYEVGDYAELITCAPHYVRSYKPLTGEELWRLKWGMDIHTSTPISSNGLIYVSSGKGRTRPLYAIRPGGRGDISLPSGQSSSQHIAWMNQKAGPITTSPLSYGDYLYTLTDAGVLRCFNARNGDLQYEQRVGGAVFFASPVAADGKLYFTSTDGEVYVVRAGPKYELLATNVFDEYCLSTPAISEGMIYIRTSRHLFCIGSKVRRLAVGRERVGQVSPTKASKSKGSILTT